ncbi:MAG: RNA pyrophosphohydrolase [Ectothiorhodospiraceae bacterium]|nr:RNA pyrophosphohydrolase [Ectothiorhodospiraceae bacterium]
MIDSDGYRANVGMILCNSQGRLLWARRIGQDAWQFPQGGVLPNETRKEALYRELHEEVGLTSSQVELLGSTKKWLRYDLPKRFLRHGTTPLCIGQKQMWYLLRLTGKDSEVQLNGTDQPEFDGWRWVDYWYPLEEVVSFKRDVYRNALAELEPLLKVMLRN